MNKEDIRQLFINKKILSKTGKRKACYLKFFDEESKMIFYDFAKNYRSDKEAWFCLCHNVEPYRCEICGLLAKFNNSTKNKEHIGYNSVCENCSCNNTSSKKSKIKKKISNRTQEQKEEINKKRKRTNKERYGDENFTLFGSESYKNNLLEKYGDEHYSNHEKAKQTNLERIGYEYNFQDPEFIKKSKETKISRYGTGNSSNYSKSTLTNLSKYGYEHMSQVPELNKKAQETKRNNIYNVEQENNCILQATLFKIYGQGWLHLNLNKIKIGSHIYISNEDIPKIIEYSSRGSKTNNYTSKTEKELVEYIRSIYSGIVEENNTSRISNYNYRNFELDIYLPEINVAFDFDGNYYHSSLMKDKYYHQRKTKACYEQGVQLIHIYEYMWLSDKERLKTKIHDFLQDLYSCLDMNWIPLNEYKNFRLTEPEEIKLKKLTIYNEGRFEKICN